MIREKERLRAQIKALHGTMARLQAENEQLRIKAEEADTANQAKSDFLAMISHEIRTPMNGVIGLTELLMETDLSERQRHFAELILNSARNLLTLINGLLDFSKIEADMMELEIEPFDLDELLDGIMDFYRIAGQRQGLEVGFAGDRRLHQWYRGDVSRIRQILENMLGNAVKFTEQGSVALEVSLEERNGNRDLIRFQIHDTGPGIADDQLDQLFQPFSQVDSSSTRRHGGTGLGLSICQQLVRLMDGDIGVSTRLGMGSTFWFTLTLPRTEKVADEQTVAIPASGEDQEQTAAASTCAGLLPYHVLVVDDDDTNRIVMQETLKKAGLCISTATNGQEAVALSDQYDFDLIFMDCQMPVMDGFEATRIIRRQHEGAEGVQRPAIIALTADATRATHNRCRRCGMVDYLIKPIDFKRLHQILDQWLPERISWTEEPLPPAQEGEPAVSPVIRTEALHQLEENIGDLGPVVRVFLDTMHKRMYQLREAISNNDTKVVRRTAHTIKGSCSQFGADELADYCQQLEDMARSGEHDPMEPLLDKIRFTAEQVALTLRARLD